MADTRLTCREELCENWAGEGCACAMLGPQPVTDAQLIRARDAARAVRTWPDWARVGYPAVDVAFIREALNVDRIVAELRVARTRLAAVEQLAEQWQDLLRTESEIMTTAQRNAWRDAWQELLAAMGGDL